jgi:hypothetical protein
MALTNISLGKRLVLLRAHPYYYRFILTLLALFVGYYVFAQKIDSLNRCLLPTGRNDFFPNEEVGRLIQQGTIQLSGPTK